MNVNIDNLEHVLSTLTGFESLSSGDLESPDSVYAKTVLKLNGVDFKHRAGTEGFLSSVKAGATKVYEMIKNFIKAIRDFFFGSKGSKQTKTIDDAVKSTQSDSKEIMSKKNDKDFNEESISFKSEYKIEKERIKKLMSNEKIKLEVDSYSAFLVKFSHDIWIGGAAGEKLKTINGIAVPNLKTAGERLEQINSEINDLVGDKSATHEYTSGDVIIGFFDVVPPLVELQKLFNEMRAVATTTLADVTKDLEHNNELAKKQENINTIESNTNGVKIREFCKKMVTASNKLTSLINYCDNKIIKIKQVMEGVKELTSK